MKKKCFSGVQHIDPKKCPYCQYHIEEGERTPPKLIVDLGFFFKDVTRSDEFAKTEIIAGIVLRNKTNKLSVSFRCEGLTKYSQFEYIHFCPMCGRDLFVY